MSAIPHLTKNETLDAHQLLKERLNHAIKGQEKTLDYILSCYFTGHHVLLEDFPGTGKTTLAKSLAALLSDITFKRVQFTPDLLPSDLTGVNIFDPSERVFKFLKGPLFCDLLLADEINRSSPRTQSALLEAMAENQVTVEGKTHPLSEQFFVIATQNPADFRGTYPLPEAQMDRFGMQCSLGYLSPAEEKLLLDAHLRGENSPPITDALPTQLRPSVLLHTREVHVSENIKDYIIQIVSATRNTSEVQLPLSPRASLSLLKVAQTFSFLSGQNFVTAETIKELAPYMLSHRLLMTSPSQNTTEGKISYINQLLEKTAIPG